MRGRAEELEYRMNAVVGTEFVLCKQWCDPVIRTVDKATKAQISIGGLIFRRDSGNKVNGGSWDTTRIYMPTEHLKSKCKRAALLSGTRARLKNIDEYLNDATDEELYRIYTTLMEVKDAIFKRVQNQQNK